MTRFKELKRIEEAIKFKNQSELEWAIKYCKLRLKIAPTKFQQQYWDKMINKLKKVTDMN